MSSGTTIKSARQSGQRKEARHNGKSLLAPTLGGHTSDLGEHGLNIRTLGAMRPPEETRMRQELAIHVDAEEDSNHEGDGMRLHPFYPLFMGGGVVQSALVANMAKIQIGRGRAVGSDVSNRNTDETDTIVSCGSVTSSLMRRTPSLVASSTMLSPDEAAEKGGLTFAPPLKSYDLLHRLHPSFSCASA